MAIPADQQQLVKHSDLQPVYEQQTTFTLFNVTSVSFLMLTLSSSGSFSPHLYDSMSSWVRIYMLQPPLSASAWLVPKPTCCQWVIFFQVFRQRGLRGRSLIAVSLRQLYPAPRLYANSLHPIRQQGNQWSPLASSKRATFLPLFPGERPDLRGGQGKGMMLSIFFNTLPLFIEEVSSNTFSHLSVKFQRAHAACGRACAFGCHWPIVTQWDSPGLCVRLSFFELPSLFNSSCCGRVGEKWEIDWGCAKSQAWF